MQAITVDEAYTYLNYVSRPFAEWVAHYYGNNHVLNSIACKLSVGLFGVSEFTMRLPSLLCGWLYLAAAYRLCRYVFGAGALMLVSFALLTLNSLPACDYFFLLPEDAAFREKLRFPPLRRSGLPPDSGRSIPAMSGGFRPGQPGTAH